MIVRISNGFVNLANMTDCRIFRDEGANNLAISIYWNYAMGEEDMGPARDHYKDADAEAIIDALDAAADAERRKAL